MTDDVNWDNITTDNIKNNLGITSDALMADLESIYGLEGLETLHLDTDTSWLALVDGIYGLDELYQEGKQLHKELEEKQIELNSLGFLQMQQKSKLVDAISYLRNEINTNAIDLATKSEEFGIEIFDDSIVDPDKVNVFREAIGFIAKQGKFEVFIQIFEPNRPRINMNFDGILIESFLSTYFYGDLDINQRFAGENREILQQILRSKAYDRSVYLSNMLTLNAELNDLGVDPRIVAIFKDRFIHSVYRTYREGFTNIGILPSEILRELQVASFVEPLNKNWYLIGDEFKSLFKIPDFSLNLIKELNTARTLAIQSLDQGFHRFIFSQTGKVDALFKNPDLESYQKNLALILREDIRRLKPDLVAGYNYILNCVVEPITILSSLSAFFDTGDDRFFENIMKSSGYDSEGNFLSISHSSVVESFRLLKLLMFKNQNFHYLSGVRGNLHSAVGGKNNLPIYSEVLTRSLKRMPLSAGLLDTLFKSVGTNKISNEELAALADTTPESKFRKAVKRILGATYFGYANSKNPIERLLVRNDEIELKLMSILFPDAFLSSRHLAELIIRNNELSDDIRLIPRFGINSAGEVFRRGEKGVGIHDPELLIFQEDPNIHLDRTFLEQIEIKRIPNGYEVRLTELGDRKAIPTLFLDNELNQIFIKEVVKGKRGKIESEEYIPLLLNDSLEATLRNLILKHVEFVTSARAFPIKEGDDEDESTVPEAERVERARRGFWRRLPFPKYTLKSKPALDRAAEIEADKMFGFNILDENRKAWKSGKQSPDIIKTFVRPSKTLIQTLWTYAPRKQDLGEEI